MDRRLIGALVVAVTVAAALAAPAGALVAGNGYPAPLPPQPVVGQCIASDIPEPVSGDYDESTVSPGDEVTTPFGPCGGEISGEVMLVGRAKGDLDDRLKVASDLSDDCARATRRATGIDVVETQSAGSGVEWSLSPNARYRWVVPDPRAQAGGRVWLACIVTPAYGKRYRGTVQDSFRGGRLPDGFGSCWAGVAVTAALQSEPCSGPHRSELIGVGRSVDDSLTAARAEASCRDIAGRVMGRADPTANGDLEIRMHPQDLDRQMQIRDFPPEVVCYVTGTGGREIVGTVVGLGDRPIGFA